ncbi:MAG: hypothetical protein ACYCYK_05050 [Candidatus Dormibacteria bacterium]
MTRFGTAPPWVGLVIVLLGGVATIVTFAAAFMAGVCDIGHSCTSSDYVVTGAFLVPCLLAFFGAPAVASLATGRWWWSTTTLPVPMAFLGYLLATGPVVASVHSEAAFLVVISVVDMAGVALVIALKRRRATRRAP